MAIKYIFCINTGRSGSKTLYEFFNQVDSVHSEHEPSPILNGTVQRAYLNDSKSSLCALIPEKLKQINQWNEQVYFESNHCFIKGFGWEVIKHLPKEEVGIIVLRKDALSIAKSYQRINCSPFNIIGSDWIIRPTLNRRTGMSLVNLFHFKCLKLIYRLYWQKFKLRQSGEFKESLPQYLKEKEIDYLCWYVEETERLTKLFLSQNPTLKVVELDTEDLNDKQKMENMLDLFDITYSDSINKVIGKKFNRKYF